MVVKLRPGQVPQQRSRSSSSSAAQPGFACVPASPRKSSARQGRSSCSSTHMRPGEHTIGPVPTPAVLGNSTYGYNMHGPHSVPILGCRKPLGTVSLLRLCLQDIHVLTGRKYKVMRDAGACSGCQAREGSDVGGFMLPEVVRSPASLSVPVEGDLRRPVLTHARHMYTPPHLAHDSRHTTFSPHRPTPLLIRSLRSTAS